MKDEQARPPVSGQTTQRSRRDSPRPGLSTLVGNIRLGHLEHTDIELVCFDALPFWEPWGK